jgi:hypothetical protein
LAIGTAWAIDTARSSDTGTAWSRRIAHAQIQRLDLLANTELLDKEHSWFLQTDSEHEDIRAFAHRGLPTAAARRSRS